MDEILQIKRPFDYVDAKIHMFCNEGYMWGYEMNRNDYSQPTGHHSLNLMEERYDRTRRLTFIIRRGRLLFILQLQAI